MSHTQVQVRISDGILWIGDDAYPVQNIARVSSKMWVPDRSKIRSKWIARIVLAVIFAGVGFAINSFLGILLLLLVAFFIYKLIDALKIQPLYELVIETSGSPQHALVSTDQALVSRLVAETTKAISNPHYALAPITVNNYNNGDNVNMIGGNSNIGIRR